MIIYFTTCNQKLYDVSCKYLIASFILHCKHNEKLYIFHENVNIEITNTNVIYIDVSDNELYTTWFTKYKDIIPSKYGGTANIESDSRLTYGKAVKWNQKTCLWFWKIVSLHEILKYISETTHFLVFLDADTEFKSTFDESFYENILQSKCSIGYHLGKFRRAVDHKMCAGIESGILVFKNDINSKNFINDLVDTYLSGNFLNYVRWDDGYVIRKLIETEKHESHCYDFTRKSTIKNVVSEGPFKRKIVHHIGKHFRLKVDQ